MASPDLPPEATARHAWLRDGAVIVGAHLAVAAVAALVLTVGPLAGPLGAGHGRDVVTSVGEQRPPPRRSSRPRRRVTPPAPPPVRRADPRAMPADGYALLPLYDDRGIARALGDDPRAPRRRRR